MPFLTNALGPIPSIIASGTPYNPTGYVWITDRRYEAWHTSVIDFLTEHGIATWGGYRFWLGITTDYPEDIFLFVSSDGQAWQPAPHHASQPTAPNATKLTNSDNNQSWFDEAETIWMNGRYADIEIRYEPTTDSIVFFFVDEWQGWKRGTISNTLFRSTETFWDAPGMGPAIVRESASLWHCWGIGYHVGDVPDIYYAASTDGGVTFSSPVRCTDGTNPLVLDANYPGHYCQHISAKQNPLTGDIEMLVNTRTGLSGDGGGIDLKGGILAHLRTTLAAPTVLSAPLAPTPVLEPSLPVSYWDTHTESDQFDGYGLYRSDFVLRESGGNVLIDLWYTGNNIPTMPQSPDGVEDARAQIGFTSGVLGLSLLVNSLPPEGTYTSSQTAKLFCNIPGSVICYTTDDTEPDPYEVLVTEDGEFVTEDGQLVTV